MLDTDAELDAADSGLIELEPAGSASQSALGTPTSQSVAPAVYIPTQIHGSTGSSSTGSSIKSIEVTVCCEGVHRIAVFDLETEADTSPVEIAAMFVRRMWSEWSLEVDADTQAMFACFLASLRFKPDVFIRTGPIDALGWSWVCFKPLGAIEPKEFDIFSPASVLSAHSSAMSTPRMFSSGALRSKHIPEAEPGTNAVYIADLVLNIPQSSSVLVGTCARQTGAAAREELNAGRSRVQLISAALCARQRWSL